MPAFALQKLAWFVATLFVASIVVFFVLEALPGDAALTQLGATATPETVAALTHKLGLDQPAAIRYAQWIGRALTGDLGTSSAYDSPVAPLIGNALAISAPLALLAIALASVVALFAGIAAARRRGSRTDVVIMAFSQVGLAAPSFWVAILLVLLFAVRWRLAPAGGFPGWGDPIKAMGALILPALALSFLQAATLTRVLRSALADVLSDDFIRTARAKGLSRRAVLWRHALPNALTPTLTILGLQFANLVGGAIVVENVFVLPGLGRLIFQAISNRDTQVVADATLVLAAIVMAVNFIVDLACAAIDPRRRMGDL